MNTADQLKRIKELLGAVTGFEDDDQQYVDDARDAVQKLIEALAEQPAQQESVAVWELFEGGWDSIADPEWMETLPVGTKLYTSPPAQRTWVGLTDEQIDRLWSQSLADTESETWLPLREFARAIEAKIKEKNQ